MFKDIIFLERELETIRIELSLKPDFNVQDAFAMLDLHKRGCVTPHQFAENLNQVLHLQ